jgi:ATP-binding cassette subfamily B protein
LCVPSSFYKKHHSGEIQGRLENDLNQTEQSLSFPLVEPLNQLTLGVGNIIFIALISWQMALVSIALCIVVLSVFYFYIKPVNETSNKIQEAIADSSAKFTDFVKGNSIIKMYNLEKWAGKRVETENKNIMNWGLKLSSINSKQMAINEINNYISTFVILGIGALFLAAGTITPGGLLASSRYTSSMVNAFLGFGNNVIYLQSILVGANRVCEILDEPTEIVGNEEQRKIELYHDPIIEFNNVSFEYAPGDSVLCNFDASIGLGQTVAIVGSSGTGKTTLMKIIMGFTSNTIKEGNIKINNKDISKCSLDYVRERITYVSQKPYLFKSSIKDNIAMGNQNASMEEIIEAAKRANAHEFITNLPQQYDTQVGNGGATLSGGQVQRIAIARAILKDAPILFFDEPTSGLDSESEKEVQKAMDRLKKDRTVVVIAHRLSTIRNADNILVLENGKVIESGDHAKLLKLNNRYAHFHKILANEEGKKDY